MRVTNCNDSGPGSLRQAVSSANPGQTVNFNLPHRCSTITLASTIVIGTNLTVAGPGANALAVSGNDANTVFDVPSGVSATIFGLTIEKGNASQGGGIANNGTLTVTDSTLSDNTGSYIGGGVINNGTLTVTNSVLSGNTAGEGGGGIMNYNGTLTVNGSTLSGNSGEYGGAIQNLNSVTINDSTLSNNIGGADGGAIYNQGGMSAITNSTLAENSADDSSGGAIDVNYGTVMVANSTLWGNKATDGVSGGIFNYDGAVNLSATIVAKSSSGDCHGDITDGGYNLADDGSCDFSGTSLSDTPSGLDPAGLQNNGGPTQTIALEPGSLAIGHVSNASFCPATDQRGLPRSVPCDIGAFQTQRFGVHRRRG